MRKLASITLGLLSLAAGYNSSLADEGKTILQGPNITQLDWNLRAPRFADLNNDGLDDLALINNSEGKIEFLIRQSDKKQKRSIGKEASKAKWEPELEDGWFEKRFMVLEQSAYDLGLADFNKDGRIDLAITGNRDAISVYLQDKEGEFEQSWTFDEFTPKQRGRTLVLTDLNQDKQEDIIALGSDKILIFLKSKGELDFTISEFYVEENAAWNLITPDLDNDELPDLMYYHSNQNAQFLALRMQIEAGEFGPEIPIEFSSAIYSQLQTAKDASPAFIYSDGRTGQVKEFSVTQESFNSGDAFKDIQSFTYPVNSNIRSAALYTWGDLNGDKRTDLIIGDAEGAQIQVFMQEKNGLFSTQQNFPAFAYLDGVSILQHPKTQKPIIVQISQNERMAGISQLSKDGELPFPSLLPLEGEPVKLISAHEAAGGFKGIVIIEKISRDYHLTEFVLNKENEWEANRQELKDLKNEPRGLALAYLEKSKPFLVILGQREASRFFKYEEGAYVEVAKEAALRKTLLYDLSSDRINFSDMDKDGVDEIFIADTGFLRKIKYDAEKDDFIISEQFNTPKRKQDAHLPIPYNRDDSGGMVYFDPKDDHLYWAGQDNRSSLQGNNQKELPPIKPVLGRHIDLGKGRQALLIGGEKRFYLLPDEGERWKLDIHNDFFEPETEDVRYSFLYATNRSDGDSIQLVGIDPNQHILELFSKSDEGTWSQNLEFTLFDQNTQRGNQQINYQPKDVGVRDLNNDGKDDLVLLVHDRLLIYY